jgi:hypothetical protein
VRITPATPSELAARLAHPARRAANPDRPQAPALSARVGTIFPERTHCERSGVPSPWTATSDLLAVIPGGPPPGAGAAPPMGSPPTPWAFARFLGTQADETKGPIRAPGRPGISTLGHFYPFQTVPFQKEVVRIT